MRDVAAAAGVHVSTVSRALDPKTRHLITPEVVTHILKLSEQLAYRPNAAAYSLKTNRSRTIGIIVPDITNPVFPPIIRGAEDALAQQNYVAILGNTDGSPQREEEIIDIMRARGVEGLLLASVKARDTRGGAAGGRKASRWSRSIAASTIRARPRWCMTSATAPRAS